MSENVEICEEPIQSLHEYGEVSIAFSVRRILEAVPINNGRGGLLLREQVVDVPKEKNYDSLPGNSPADWTKRFDVSRWGLIVARSEGRRVGGAVIAFDCLDASMLEGRSDLALLWDIRVQPSLRGRGTGSALFHAAESWAIERQCRLMKIETQNTNVEACRFYARQGCTLGAVNRFAYPELPDEVQLLWYKKLGCACITSGH